RGVQPSKVALEPVLAALAVGGEAAPSAISGDSAAMAVSPRWPGQQLAQVAHVRIAIDSDLIDLQPALQRLTREGLMPSEMTVAQQVGWLYILRGADFVHDLRGAFAVSIWDEKAQRLLLVTDRMGLKTLYWTRERERFLFASRPSAVRAAQANPSDANADAILQYLLFSVVPAPLTGYRGIERLLPGRALVFENGEVTQRQYWDASYVESEDRNVGAWAARVREGIRKAVHLQLDGLRPEDTGA